MERLTIRTEKGAALKLNNPKTEQEAKDQLMEVYKVAINKLAEYEEAEADGRIMKLKRKVGTKVYVIRYGKQSTDIASGRIFGVTHDGLEIIRRGTKPLGFDCLEFMLMDSKNVFGSKEEAKLELCRRRENE